MLTTDDMQQIAKLLDQKLETTEKRITDKLETTEKRLGERIDSVDIKVETVLSQSKKEHMEIMETIVESNEANGQQLTDHADRINQLEEHAGLAKPHKN